MNFTVFSGTERLPHLTTYSAPSTFTLTSPTRSFYVIRHCHGHTASSRWHGWNPNTEESSTHLYFFYAFFPARDPHRFPLALGISKFTVHYFHHPSLVICHILDRGYLLFAECLLYYASLKYITFSICSVNANASRTNLLSTGTWVKVNLLPSTNMGMLQLPVILMFLDSNGRPLHKSHNFKKRK